MTLLTKKLRSTCKNLSRRQALIGSKILAYLFCITALGMGCTKNVIRCVGAHKSILVCDDLDVRSEVFAYDPSKYSYFRDTICSQNICEFLVDEASNISFLQTSFKDVIEFRMRKKEKSSYSSSEVVRLGIDSNIKYKII